MKSMLILLLLVTVAVTVSVARRRPRPGKCIDELRKCLKEADGNEEKLVYAMKAIKCHTNKGPRPSGRPRPSRRPRPSGRPRPSTRPPPPQLELM
ncbi:hypothetical protein P5673_007622 [Acropora cervicornis]|uniref:Uncharacterized protein n=1 Tax=Acropora cervicornis TaxID=6130 RepID=A0AAD9VBE3_ACRCE|nr:hypothetical protein P5673_007622 [Acropora cervicornis]